jgi:hypothetical protein
MAAISRVLGWIYGLLRFVWRALWVTLKYTSIGLGVFVLVLLIGNVGFATKRDKPHRNLHPQVSDCVNEKGWSILAEVQNNEMRAIAKDPSWERKFQCAIQTHLVPSETGSTPLKYHLAFLEFKEDGSPQPLADRPPDSRALSQYALLQEHLRSPERKSNFVVVFAHGWRHDARVGNGNVADFRHYAAHVARFLSDRCRDEQRFCGTEVTAIYVGWRGARVDEDKIRYRLGETVGGLLATASMWITLFDRKPISEAVGPAALTALRGLDRILDNRKIVSAPSTTAAATPSAAAPATPAATPSVTPPPLSPVTPNISVPPAPPTPTASNEQRMIVIGHSLGGNLLMTAIKDQLIKNVMRHEPGKPFESPVGDLVVLINPASEAANWTGIQHAVWQRIAFRTTEARPGSTVEDGHKLFNSQQPPVVMSITAARTWPPSGIWQQDCEWLRLPSRDRREAEAKAKMLPLITNNSGIYVNDVNYDWATFDLFPFFKFDFRPLASTVQRIADRIAERESVDTGACPNPSASKPKGIASYFWREVVRPLDFLASLMRNAPFMNRDQEQTHTIGHFDPVRPSTDTLIERATLPIKPFGTTHELIGDRDRNSEKPIDYHRIPYGREAACAAAPHWLWRARHIKAGQNGTLWDSSELEPLPDGRLAKPAAQILHSFLNAGMAPITRANDPFWNVRAFDNALSEHGGYMLSSFICAIHQFVMDDVAAPLAQ